MRFHSYHGKNIELLKEGTVAHRRFSFANSITFSERPLKPYELFLLEINSNEFGWSGHLRFGLTVLDPGQQPALPFYALPDLNASGLAWIFAITCSAGRHNINSIHGQSEHDQRYRRRGSSSASSSTNQNEEEEAGPSNASATDQSEDAADPMPPVPPFLQILAESTTSMANGDAQKGAELIDGRVRLPTDVGSRIGVYYEVSAADSNGGSGATAEMHFVINGVDQGRTEAHIPFNGKPLYAIVDVYGTTKQVEIVQPVQTVNSLQHSCRNCILKYVPYDVIDHLPLPEKLKCFLYRPSYRFR